MTCPTPEKKAYRTKRKAVVRLDQIRVARAKTLAPGGESRAYRCECGSWHLTSKTVTFDVPAPRALSSGGLTFPTRPGRRDKGVTVPLLGMPRRATPCRCKNPLHEIDGGCARCGHWPSAIIDHTFAMRARQIASRSQQAAA